MAALSQDKSPKESIRGWVIVVCAALMGIFLLGLGWAIHAPSRAAPPDEATKEAKRARTKAQEQAPSWDAQRWKQQPPTSHRADVAVLDAAEDSAAQEASHGEQETPPTAQAPRVDVAARGTQAPPPHEEAPAAARPDAAPAPDMELTHADPINQQVLGPGRWMARLEPEAQFALDDEIDKSPAQAIIDRQQRQNQAMAKARQLARGAAYECLARHAAQLPKRQGQVLIAAWIEGQEGRQQQLIRPNIQAVVGLHSEPYLECILELLRQAPLGVYGAESLRVELPVFVR